MLDIPSLQPIVYSDFNCPFCFALNEWLAASDRSDDVRWVGIEHMPDIPPGGWTTPAATTELNQEITSVLQRAPGLDLVEPGFRPNSRLSIAAMTLVDATLPEAASSFRSRVFHALWREGQDISNPEFIAELLASVGVSDLSDLTKHVARVLVDTRRWRDKGHDRFPMIVAPSGTSYLGLGDPRALGIFLGSALFDQDSNRVCRFSS